MNAAWLCRLIVAATLATGFASSARAHYMALANPAADDPVVNDNCQFFALAIALAWWRDHDLTPDSPVDLLALQDRLAIAARASFHARTADGDSTAGGRSISHGDLAVAVAEATAKRYALHYADVEPGKLIDTIRERTRNITPQLKLGQVQKLGVDVAVPVLIAARFMAGGSNSYGHLLPVFSVSAEKAPSLLILLAKARLVGDESQRQRLAAISDFDCQFRGNSSADLSGLDYVAQLSWRPASSFQWHRRGQRVRVFWLERSKTREN
ncbi:MAG: hypothetical protein AB7N24_22625 [Dehalococcoidia bacterium]